MVIQVCSLDFFTHILFLFGGLPFFHDLTWRWGQLAVLLLPGSIRFPGAHIIRVFLIFPIETLLIYEGIRVGVVFVRFSFLPWMLKVTFLVTWPGWIINLLAWIVVPLPLPVLSRAQDIYLLLEQLILLCQLFNFSRLLFMLLVLFPILFIEAFKLDVPVIKFLHEKCFLGHRFLLQWVLFLLDLLDSLVDFLALFDLILIFLFQIEYFLLLFGDLLLKLGLFMRLYHSIRYLSILGHSYGLYLGLL